MREKIYSSPKLVVRDIQAFMHLCFFEDLSLAGLLCKVFYIICTVQSTIVLQLQGFLFIVKATAQLELRLKTREKKTNKCYKNMIYAQTAVSIDKISYLFSNST